MLFLIWKIIEFQEIYETIKLNQIKTTNFLLIETQKTPNILLENLLKSSSWILLIPIGWISNLFVINLINFHQIREALFSYNFDQFYLNQKNYNLKFDLKFDFLF